MNRSGPTGAVTSVLKLDSSLFMGDLSVDLSFNPNAVRGQEGLDAMRALLMTYVDNYGHALQINVLSADELRKAQQELFHNLYGVSPKQYILSARLRWAKTMLKNTEDSITEIAKSCGFDNVYYFSRAFRIHEGVSPSEYRNHHSQIGETGNG